jgi:hypothetical protein
MPWSSSQAGREHGQFFAELKRRHIYAYCAYARSRVLIQIVNNIAPALKLPDWA